MRPLSTATLEVPCHYITASEMLASGSSFAMFLGTHSSFFGTRSSFMRSRCPKKAESLPHKFPHTLCCLANLQIAVFLFSSRKDTPRMILRNLITKLCIRFCCGTVCVAHSKPYKSTGTMTVLNRRILRWNHKTLFSELKALDALLIRSSTSAVRLQSSLMVLPRYSKVDTTSTEFGCNVMGSGSGYCTSSVSLDGRTAMVLVFCVLMVRPICWHFSSSDYSMSFKPPP